MALVTRTARLAGGMLLCCAALTACGDDDAPSSGATPSDDAEPIITLNRQSDAWPAALIIGSLTEREGCLLIDDDVAVFPFGTTRDSSGIAFPDGEQVSVPSDVRMAGGQFDDLTLAQSDLPIVPMDAVRTCASATGATGFVWAMPS
ncbi:MAG: hypothetical protein JWN84_2923 [Nocardioides sp.]|nr:hypothetical protein [Nocardioides sp.]